eukprot:gene30283-36592_t
MGELLWLLFIGLLVFHYGGHVFATDIDNVSFPCPHKFVRDRRAVYDNSGILIDPENKILLDWTPKAACTVAVSLMFHHMGIVYGRDYHHFPHNLRLSFYEQCGLATLAMLADPTWLRVKVVRNPFDRAISSYFHSLRYADAIPAIKMYIPNYNNVSFADFIDILLSKPPSFMYNPGNGSHWYFQHKMYEIEAVREQRPSPFDVILHVENLKEDLVKLNRLVKRGHHGEEFPVTSVHSFYKSGNHYETVSVSRFLGRLQWWQVKDLHPANYSVMYDDLIRQKVTKLFHWDLALYNYSWPY